jgi:hypothetical protein
MPLAAAVASSSAAELSVTMATIACLLISLRP